MNDPELQQLLRKISHDLSAPARSAVGFSKILLETNEGLDARAKKWLELIKNEGLYAQNVLSRLSHYAKLFDEGHVISDCDLGQILGRVMVQSPVIADAVSSGKLAVDCGELATVKGIVPLWHILFTELLENSIVHNDEAQSIQCEISGDQRQLCFSDDGVGIKSAFFERACQPLVTLTSARTAGFGLAVCTKITSIFHGTLTLGESDSGGLSVILNLA